MHIINVCLLMFTPHKHFPSFIQHVLVLETKNFNVKNIYIYIYIPDPILKILNTSQYNNMFCIIKHIGIIKFKYINIFLI